MDKSDVELDSPATIELVTITINYKGEDYLITVDMHTATELLNDKKLAEKYIISAYVKFLENEANYGNKKNDKNVKKVWRSKGKPTEDDKIATHLFLQLRQKYAKKFSEKNTFKHYLWIQIAKEMYDAGYNIFSQKEDVVTKCKKRFSKLATSYVEYTERVNIPGAEPQNPPPFLDQLHSILGRKERKDDATNHESNQDKEQASSSRTYLDGKH